MNISLRPGCHDDLEFARRIYFDTMRWIIERLFDWDEAREITQFAQQFVPDEVRIIVADGEQVGWLQVEEQEVATFLKQIYVEPRFQRRSVGTSIMAKLISASDAEGKPIVLGVVKINPARRLYERLGFRVTHEDEYKVYMRRDPSAPKPG